MDSKINEWIDARFYGLENRTEMYGVSHDSIEGQYMMVLDLWALLHGIEHMELRRSLMKYTQRELPEIGCFALCSFLQFEPLEKLVEHLRAFRLEFQATHDIP